MSVKVPDAIEPYRGYKALDVAEDGTLYSPSKTQAWPIGKRLEAQCTVGLSHWTWVPVEGKPRKLDAGKWVTHQPRAVSAVSSAAVMQAPPSSPPPKPNNPLPPGWNWSWEPLTHDSPDEACTCGIYVASTPEGCLSYLGPQGVIAEIALWGKVIPAHSGARGQYAYPQKFLAPSLVAPELAQPALLYGVEIELLDEAEPVVKPAEPGDILSATINAGQENAKDALDQAIADALKAWDP